VRVIQQSVGFIALSTNETIDCAGLKDCWNKLYSLFLSEMGNTK